MLRKPCSWNQSQAGCARYPETCVWERKFVGGKDRGRCARRPPSKEVELTQRSSSGSDASRGSGSPPRPPLPRSTSRGPNAAQLRARKFDRLQEQLRADAEVPRPSVEGSAASEGSSSRASSTSTPRSSSDGSLQLYDRRTASQSHSPDRGKRILHPWGSEYPGLPSSSAAASSRSSSASSRPSSSEASSLRSSSASSRASVSPPSPAGRARGKAARAALLLPRRLSSDCDEFMCQGLQAGEKERCLIDPVLRSKQYKALARKLHPDKPGGSTELFQKLNACNEELRSKKAPVLASSFSNRSSLSSAPLELPPAPEPVRAFRIGSRDPDADAQDLEERLRRLCESSDCYGRVLKRCLEAEHPADLQDAYVQADLEQRPGYKCLPMESRMTDSEEESEEEESRVPESEEQERSRKTADGRQQMAQALGTTAGWAAVLGAAVGLGGRASRPTPARQQKGQMGRPETKMERLEKAYVTANRELDSLEKGSPDFQNSPEYWKKYDEIIALGRKIEEAKRDAKALQARESSEAARHKEPQGMDTTLTWHRLRSSQKPQIHHRTARSDLNRPVRPNATPISLPSRSALSF